ncbi:MAG: hypothetical protein WC391_02700 [Methanoregula sp.]
MVPVQTVCITLLALLVVVVPNVIICWHIVRTFRKTTARCTLNQVRIVASNLKQYPAVCGRFCPVFSGKQPKRTRVPGTMCCCLLP